MLLKTHKLLLTTLLVCGTVVSLDARRCKSAWSCKRSKKCECYCSEVGHFRKKHSGDKPVWVKNDPNEIYCYCKQWDLDNYPLAERPREPEEVNE